jgi:hypothetical protein
MQAKKDLSLPGLVHNHENIIFVFFIAIYSFIVLFFCSMSSPFYYTNPWVDVNIYFSIGKGLFNGKVMYAELFDNKGPLTYFIYGLGYLISNKSFLGVYFLESISLTIVLYYEYLIAKLFLPQSAHSSGINRYAAISIFIFPLAFLNYKIFNEGGSAEEFILPFIMYGFFVFLKAQKQNEALSYRENLFFGLCTAAIFFIKMNVIMIFFPFTVFIFADLLIKKRYSIFFINAISYICGVLLVALPFIIYFLATGSIGDFYNVYFKFNSLYSNIHLNIATLFTFVRTMIDVVYVTYVISFFIVSGMVLFIFSNHYFSTKAPKINIVLSFFMLILMIYLSGVHRPYHTYIPITVYAIFPVIVLLNYFQKEYAAKIKNVHILILAVISFSFIIRTNNNLAFSKMLTSEPTMAKWARLIVKEENPTILNFQTMELGLHTLTGLVPSNKYFFTHVIPHEKYPAVLDEQLKIIDNSEVQFVIALTGPNTSNAIPVIYENLSANYDLVDSYIDAKNMYLLYKAKNYKQR